MEAAPLMGHFIQHELMPLPSWASVCQLGTDQTAHSADSRGPEACRLALLNVTGVKVTGVGAGSGTLSGGLRSSAVP